MRDFDDELPDGVYHDDEWPTIPCPWCREEIAEESQQCPKCERYLSKEDAPSSPKSWFWIVLMAAAILCALLLLL